MKKIVLLLCLLIMIGAGPVLAQAPDNPTDAMVLANRNYEAGQYDQAAAEYEAILKTGLHHSDIYYNLGNAYFKQGDLGRAILNYRRAHRLNPRDVDINANLSVARARTADKIDAPADEGGLSDLIKLAEEWLTLREASIIALALWLIINVLALVAIQSPGLRQYCLIAIGVLSIFLLAGIISMTNRFYTEQYYPPAVVLADEVEVTSGPGTAAQYLVEFTLHAGAEVNLLESRPGWRRIALPGDLQGWVPEDSLEPVISQ